MFQCSGVDLIGQTYGRLSVLRFSHEPRAYRRYWVCRCACGTERILREDYIKSALATCATCRRAEIANRRGPRMCSSCREMLPRDRFYRDRTTTDTLARYCTSCSRSKAQTLRARMQRRRPEDIVQPDEKQCRECGVVKPADDFWTDRTQPDGLASRCAECKTLRQRAWYERVGPERRLPRACLARYHMFPADLNALLDAQSGNCAICGITLDGPKPARSVERFVHRATTAWARSMTHQRCYVLQSSTLSATRSKALVQS